MVVCPHCNEPCGARCGRSIDKGRRWFLFGTAALAVSSVFPWQAKKPPLVASAYGTGVYPGLGAVLGYALAGQRSKSYFANLVDTKVRREFPTVAAALAAVPDGARAAKILVPNGHEEVFTTPGFSFVTPERVRIVMPRRVT